MRILVASMADPPMLLVPSWMLCGSVIFGESVEESSDDYYLGQFPTLASAQAFGQVWIDTHYSRAGRFDGHGRWVLTVEVHAYYFPGVAGLGG